MQFKIGDEVNVTKNFLLNLPGFTDRVKDGGKIAKLFKNKANVDFHSGCNYHIYYRSLELKPVKNQQLLFKFMG